MKTLEECAAEVNISMRQYDAVNCLFLAADECVNMEGTHAAIREAVAAEREACASLAELEPTPAGIREADTIRLAISAAIRARGDR